MALESKEEAEEDAEEDSADEAAPAPKGHEAVASAEAAIAGDFKNVSWRKY